MHKDLLNKIKVQSWFPEVMLEKLIWIGFVAIKGQILLFYTYIDCGLIVFYCNTEYYQRMHNIAEEEEIKG
jgi:hypothetical protein